MVDVTATNNKVTIAYPTRIGTGEMIGSDKDKVRNLPNADPIPLGTIYGVVRSISFRNNTQNAEEGPATALVGAFEFVPANPDRPSLRSATCYLPKSVHALVVENVLGPDVTRPTEMPKRGKKQDVLGMETPIMYGIGAKKSEGAVGYAFEVRELVELKQSDPLAAVRAAHNFQIPGRDTRPLELVAPAAGQVTVGESAKDVTPKAPAKVTAKKKKK